ncbi:MAG: RluA family pseudouridine synthase [Bacteroidia bacterium]|nr:RluA family pseudouridine synthase [Bacteroidia bacterium]
MSGKIHLSILYEDNHIIAVNKAPSDIVQHDNSGDISLEVQLKEYIKKKYNKPSKVFLGVVHRLDRPVSGVVLFARTGKALTRLNEMFKNKEIQKFYWAIVGNCPPQPEGVLKHYIVRDTGKNKSYCFNAQVKNSKSAEMLYKLISYSEKYYLLELNLLTGRHHQIRSQLSKIGCPIKGDLKYGYPRSNKESGIYLHARKIKFVHPVKKEKIGIIAPLPDDNLWNFFKNVRCDD